MTIDEHFIECVLGILENKRVSDRIYEIVNRSPAPKKTLNLIPGSKVNRITSTSVKDDSNGEQSNMRCVISKYKDENEHLQKKCTEQEKKILLIESENNELKNKNHQLNVKLENFVQLLAESEQTSKENSRLNEESITLQQELQHSKEKYAVFSNPLAVFTLYESLPEDMKRKNLNYISDRSVFSFVSTGIMNLERFWDFIKEELLAERLEYIEKLKSVFDFFFEMKNETGQVCSRNECSIGEEFNTEKHIMMLGGKNLSTISEILFLGFCDSKGKIIRKSIVKVND